MTQADREEILLVYDKECPVCDNYCRLVRVEESVGDLKLIDAREPSDVLDDITALGLDIDQGMVLKMAGEIYYGADAIHALALISSRSGLFNRLNYLMFFSKRVPRILYPALRGGRNLLLKILGKTKINNLGRENNDRF
jgi:predicted DCC family thiol-disulfide oxidoreductase YuxK